jgi:hypothetical protein
MPLLRFVACLDAVEQIVAAERMAFVSDMASVVSGIFAEKGSNPIAARLDLLGDIASGVFNGDPAE